MLGVSSSNKLMTNLSRVYYHVHERKRLVINLLDDDTPNILPITPRSVASLDMHGAYSTKEEAKLCETKPGHHFEKDDLENPLGLPSGAFAITARPYWPTYRHISYKNLQRICV